MSEVVGFEKVLADVADTQHDDTVAPNFEQDAMRPSFLPDDHLSNIPSRGRGLGASSHVTRSDPSDSNASDIVSYHRWE
jgi:hypothetical protein